MRCFSTLLFLSAIVALLGIVSTTWADTVIFQDDFEGYTASSTWPSTDDANPGTPPIGDEWWVAEPDVGRVQVLSVAAGNNSCAGPHEGSNYLQTWQVGAVATAMIPSVGQDLVEQNQNFTLDMWVYKNLVDGWTGLQTIGGYDNDDPGGAQGGRSFLLYFREDGRLQYWAGQLYDTGLTYTSDKWLHLVLEANFVTSTYNVTLDGETATGLDFATAATKIQHVSFSGSTDLTSSCRGAYDDIVMSVGDFVAPIPGDANGDGYVNATDAQRLAENWLSDSGGLWTKGDFNADGIVDDLDATLMAANWGRTPDAVASAPEPSSVALMIAMGLAGLGYTFRKTR